MAEAGASGQAGPGPGLAAQRRAVEALALRLGAQRIETHISFVLLAGDHAYKIKKAVNLGFLDFTTLAQRRFFCEEELRVNRRTAPELYLEVLPLTGTAEQPRLGGGAAVLDWVLHMRAFSQHGLWDRLAASGALQPAHIDAGVEAVYDLHRIAAVAHAGTGFGQAAQVRGPLRDSLRALSSQGPTPHERAALGQLAAWEAQAFESLRPAFEQRQRDGQVRECHGDLHLGNVAQVDGRTRLFDALEFSAELRWTDVMSDVAFMAMDLRSHGLPRLSSRFVNACIERSGDVAGLRVLRYYLVHRALVRAKVAALRRSQLADDDVQHRQQALSLRHHLDLALAFTRASPPALMLTHGLSGSGKTLHTQSLLELCGAIRFRADVERKRLFGLAPLARSDAALKARLYTDAATRATQVQLLDAAASALQSGYSVILDATYLAWAAREQVRALAERLRVPFAMLQFDAGADTLRRRVWQRSQRGDDASDADLEVLEAQLAQAQPLQQDELAAVFRVDAEAEFDDAAMPLQWAPLLRRLGLACA